MRPWLSMLWALCVLIPLSGAEVFVSSIPGVDSLYPLRLRAGYLPTGDKFNSSLFYLFLESEGSAADDPLVLWLNG